MKPESKCDDARAELSALMDGEVDERVAGALQRHLSECGECRRYESSLRAVRSALRVVPAGTVPDLTESIMERVASLPGALERRARRIAVARTGLVAAAATIALLLGVTGAWMDEPADLARAGEIVGRVKAAARSLNSYRATYDVAEYGWHEDVAQRNFVADLWFGAPERFRMELRDLTSYPQADKWPRNDVEIVAAPGRYWIEEPFSCPVEALPACGLEADDSARSVVGRAPFDGSTALPTDLILPLETLVGAGGGDVEGLQFIAGRIAYRIDLTYRQARPLIAAVQAGGSWRPFHPLDEVRLWIDEETWFPLRFQVIAGASAERSQWALNMSVDDKPGDLLLDVSARSFSTPEELSPQQFSVPRSGIASSRGFVPGPDSLFRTPGAPSNVAGLEPYRAGTLSGAPVLSYSDGMTWLKVVLDETASRRTRAAGADPSLADELKLDERSFAYYRPADDTFRRQIDIFAEDAHVHLESNLDRKSLIRIAASTELDGKRVGAGSLGGAQLSVKRLNERLLATLGWAQAPTDLPSGYDAGAPNAALAYGRGRATTTVLYYRNAEAEFDGSGVRITQTRSPLPPSSERFVTGLDVNGNAARWSPDRGELEWIDDGIYRAVKAPTFDLSIVIDIAESMR